MRAFEFGSATATPLCLALVAALSACGTSSRDTWDDAGTGTSSSGGGKGGPNGAANPGSAIPSGDDGGLCLICARFDAAAPDAGSIAPASQSTPPMAAIGTVTAPDCAGCTFPPAGAPPCAATAPSITIVYPNDTVLVPPNLGVISVQWTPYGPPFSRYEVDFSQPSQSPITDLRIVTACTTQTNDAQSGTPSGGCELVVDPASWKMLAAANRQGTNPIAITVRGTTDGMCASTSMNTIHMSIADEDLLGTYYYWKSTISANGVGGQIWAKIFGDLQTAEADVTANSVAATCNGCHSLSRDGSRMVIYSDDDDSDDEYSDVAGSYLDMTTMPNATEFPGGIAAKGGNGGLGQPPGFSAINPQATYYVSSNGYPLTAAGASNGSSSGYPVVVASNAFSEWNGQNGTFVGPIPIGATGTRPTMPDWSVDGSTMVYVQPTGDYSMAGGTKWKKDDAHIYGGSLYTVPYTGNGAFGTPAVFLQSAGENNYYPSYSPDQPMSFVIFNRVANSMGAAANCSGGFCPDDSFSNPAARVMLMQNAANAKPVDLEKANGSPAAAPLPWSNSYPRWAPFVQSYRGGKILWFTFSSTRDYGVRVLNHKTGMYQCYPADAAETPGAAHKAPFAAACQEPQLWMASLTFADAQGASVDPSGAAFWIPYQDITTHNHTAQWTWIPNAAPPAGCSCSMVFGPCGANNGGCGCCAGQSLVCTGSGQCIRPPM